MSNRLLGVALARQALDAVHQVVRGRTVVLARGRCCPGPRSTRCRRASPPRSRARRARARARPHASARPCARPRRPPPAAPRTAGRPTRVSISASCASESSRKSTRTSGCVSRSAAIAPRSAASSTWLATSMLRAPAARPACTCVTVAKVRPQAPASSWRRNSCGDIVVLPCGAKRTLRVVGEALHPADVVRQRVAPDHGQRQRQVAGQHVPALCADLRPRHRRGAVRKALERGIEQGIEEVGHARDYSPPWRFSLMDANSVHAHAGLRGHDAPPTRTPCIRSTRPFVHFAT